MKMCFVLTSKLVLMSHLTLLSPRPVCVVMEADAGDGIRRLCLSVEGHHV